jgi:hypothetical protein
MITVRLRLIAISDFLPRDLWGIEIEREVST